MYGDDGKWKFGDGSERVFIRAENDKRKSCGV